MPFSIGDRVKETSQTSGTAAIVLSGAVAGFRTFSSVMAVGDTCWYYIVAGVNWEVGIGTLTATNTLARTTILSSSNGNAIVSFPAGTKEVAQTLPASIASALGTAAIGQCRLNLVASTSIRLDRFNGSLLFINGGFVSVPAGGVSLANTGLTAATLYYVYAFLSGTTLTLEAVTTAPATDTTYGHQIKNGDPTRTLVGMVYMGAGSPGTFVTSATQRFVRSYFNRPTVALSNNTFGATTASVNPTYAELGSGQRLELVCFDGEVLSCLQIGRSSSDQAAGNTYGRAMLDGTVIGAAPTNTGTLTTSYASAFSTTLTGGYHYIAPAGSVLPSGSTGTFQASLQAELAA